MYSVMFMFIALHLEVRLETTSKSSNPSGSDVSAMSLMNFLVLLLDPMDLTISLRVSFVMFLTMSFLTSFGDVCTDVMMVLTFSDVLVNAFEVIEDDATDVE